MTANQFTNALTNELLDRLPREVGGRWWRSNTGGGYSVGALKTILSGGKARPIKFGLAGSADITGILPGGRRSEVEIKSPKDKQSDAQKAFAQMIKSNGGVYVLAGGEGYYCDVSGVSSAAINAVASVAMEAHGVIH